MEIDWHRALALPIFAVLLSLAFATGEARIIVGAIGLLAWPFVFIWYGDALAETTGLHFGLVDRPSNGSWVRAGGWIILIIYLGVIAYGAIAQLLGSPTWSSSVSA